MTASGHGQGQEMEKRPVMAEYLKSGMGKRFRTTNREERKNRIPFRFGFKNGEVMWRYGAGGWR